MEIELLKSLINNINCLNVDNNKEDLRMIKESFKQKDFNLIFKNEKLLSIYQMNYLKTRVLLYLEIFKNLDFGNAKGLVNYDRVEKEIKNVAILGGGNGAELLALYQIFNPDKVIVQDLAKYPHLDTLITKFVPDEAKVTKINSDLLDPKVELKYLKTQDLITCCYLLNELLTISKSGFVKLLTRIIELMKQSAFLLVVEPSSDFQTVLINSRKWSIFDLLDTIAKLKVVDRHTDKWFRVPKDVTASDDGQFKIHNSRTTMRLYQKI